MGLPDQDIALIGRRDVSQYSLAPLQDSRQSLCVNTLQVRLMCCNYDIKACISMDVDLDLCSL